MRRTDREITDAEKSHKSSRPAIAAASASATTARLYNRAAEFRYAEENGKRVFYFHSAKSGRKLDLIAGTPSVGFELDVNYALVEARKPAGIPPGFKALSARGAFPLWRRPRRKKRLCRL